jgi:hypothetical protein
METFWRRGVSLEFRASILFKNDGYANAFVGEFGQRQIEPVGESGAKWLWGQNAKIDFLCNSNALAS